MSTKTELAVRNMRKKIFDYPEDKEDQATRVLLYLKERMFRARRDNEPRGPYSGLTRAELRRTGTCEPDWY